ncbi:DDE_3 domain-containing protein [Trichonephila clavipes]|nr:DDE_3 domain-containing protein [Trichonephila clavipes]
MSQRRRLPNSFRWRAVGWMEMGLSQADAARRLNVSRSVVQRLWDQYQSEDSVSRRPFPGRPRSTTPAEDRFLALSARRKEPYCAQLVADHFQASGRRTSATTVRNRLHNAGTVTGLRYRDEILDPYVRPYAAAIGNDFILMDDNARPHRARIVEGIWRITVWNEWNGQLDLRPESDRTSLGLSLQRGFCFKSSSKVVT